MNVSGAQYWTGPHFMKLKLTVVAATAALMLAASANAGLVNGGFESSTNGPGQVGYNTSLTGWSVPSGGYTFLFNGSTSDSAGANGEYGNLQLWGLNNGGVGPTYIGPSPAGGNFIGQDGAFQDQPLQQTISGLNVGETYAVSFYWGAAQQSGFYSPTTDSWQVSLGSQTQTTTVLNNVSQGFTGWQPLTTMDFTATSASEVLSFLAVGSPAGVPPFAVLDGVSLVGVPEPAAWALMFVGLGFVGGAARMRRRGAPATVETAAV